MGSWKKGYERGRFILTMIPINKSTDTKGRPVYTYVDTDELSDEDYWLYNKLQDICKSKKFDRSTVVAARRDAMLILNDCSFRVDTKHWSDILGKSKAVCDD